MKNPFNARAPNLDAGAIQHTIRRALASAGLDTQSGPMRTVVDTIDRAMAAAGLRGTAPQARSGDTIDVEARVVDTRSPAPAPASVADGPVAGLAPAAAGATTASPADARKPPQAGSFTAHSFSNQAGRLAYKVYLPAGPLAQPPAMVVMLHGCTQSADDFAQGTQMNRLADAQGLLVVYPEQATAANASRCWNWFQPQDQRRDAGEPSLIAGAVRAVAQQHGVDVRRIFVAGLSAGAAMAVTLGETYPDVFAAVGAHSGLPYGSAQDVASALAAMKGGRGLAASLQRMPGAGAAPRKQARQAVPVIVFHGDRDHTVQHSNGAQIVQQALDAHAAQTTQSASAADAAHATPDGAGALRATSHTGVAPGGRGFTRVVHANAAGQACVEHWTLQGAGHAWSGGHAGGSYTDASGPDASAEMLRFFLALPRAGTA